MMNVIASEIYKIRKSKLFAGVVVLLLGMTLLSFVYTVYVKFFSAYSIEEKAQFIMTGIMGWQSSFSGDFIFYVILIFAAGMLTLEYAHGTIRQMACRGIARWKLVLGQYMALAAVISALMLGFGVLNMVLNAVFDGMGEAGILRMLSMIVGLLCMFWGMTGIGTLFAILFKNSALTMGVCMLFVVGSNYLIALLTEMTGSQAVADYALSHMKGIIITLEASRTDQLRCGLSFLVMGLVSVGLAMLLFSGRDVD